MPKNSNRHSELHTLLTQLNLTRMAEIFADVALRAAKEGLSHEAYLYELARQEEEQRTQRRTARLVRASGLPVEKTFRTLALSRLCWVGTRRLDLSLDQVCVNPPPNRTYTFLRIRLSSHSSVSWFSLNHVPYAPDVLSRMNGSVAVFTYHQSLSSEATHPYYPCGRCGPSF